LLPLRSRTGTLRDDRDARPAPGRRDDPHRSRRHVRHLPPSRGGLMFTGFPLFPPQASTFASRVDALYFFLLAISGFFSLLIATLVVVFSVRFRRRSATEMPRPIHGSLALELTWTLIPLGLVLIVFVWRADVFVSARRVPPGAMEG